MAEPGRSPGAALFRACPGCEQGKIYREDAHEVCIYCLREEAHDVASCAVCTAFSSHTRRDRAMRAAAHFASQLEAEGKRKKSSALRRASSEEPPAKKRQKDKGAGGSRPTHKTDLSVRRAASTGARTPSSTRPSPKSHSRWDKRPGPSTGASTDLSDIQGTEAWTRSLLSTTLPSTEAACTAPSMIPSTRASTSTPSTEVSTTKPRPSTKTKFVPSTGRKIPSTSPSTGRTPSTGKHQSPLLLVESSEEQDMHPRVGFKTVPGSAVTKPPAQGEQTGSLKDSMVQCLASMKEMVRKHQKTLERAQTQLEAQQADTRRDKQKDEERFQKLLDEQRASYQQELDRQRDEAEQREQTRMSQYARELEKLRSRQPQPRQDPIKEFQEKELQALKQSQETEAEGEEYDDDEEEEYEEPAGPNPEERPLGDPDEGQEEEEDDYPDEPEGAGDPAFPKPGPAYVPKPSPPEDSPSFVALIHRAAAHFRLPLEKTQPSTSYLLAKLDEPVKTVTALPIEPLLWESGQEVMKAPASTPAVSARIDKKYRVPASAPRCFRGQPDPESIISSSAKGASQVPSHMLSPPTKESRRLDNMGKKILASASLQVRTANYSAVLARYDRDMWDVMGEVIADLPEDKKEQAERTLAEGRLVSNNLLKTALDSADSGFHQMNHGVWLRRMGWLSTSSFNTELHHRILDLPFDGDHVFGPEVDRVLLEQKNYKETIKAMTPLTRARGSSFRGNFRARGARRGYAQPFQQQQAQQPLYQQQYSAQYQQPAPQRGFQQARQGGRPRRGGRGQRAPKPQ